YGTYAPVLVDPSRLVDCNKGEFLSPQPGVPGDGFVEKLLHSIRFHAECTKLPRRLSRVNAVHNLIYRRSLSPRIQNEHTAQPVRSHDDNGATSLLMLKFSVLPCTSGVKERITIRERIEGNLRTTFL